MSNMDRYFIYKIKYYVVILSVIFKAQSNLNIRVDSNKYFSNAISQIFAFRILHATHMASKEERIFLF